MSMYGQCLLIVENYYWMERNIKGVKAMDTCRRLFLFKH